MHTGSKLGLPQAHASGERGTARTCVLGCGSLVLSAGPLSEAGWGGGESREA